MPQEPTVRSARRAAAPVAAGLALALLASPPAARAQSDGISDSTAVLTGRVVSAMTGGPLADSRVVLKRSDRGTVTDSAGRFTLRGVPAGADTVHVSLIGFAEQQVPVTLKAGHTTRVTLLLSETVLKVEDITVEATRRPRGKLAGFERRRQRGFGHFITPEEIEQRNPQNTSDILRGIPGVYVGPQRFGRTEVRIERRSPTTGCQPVYWVDGALYRDFNVDDLNPMDLLAVEVYRGPSEAPAHFRFQSEGCGIIVIWTREGGPQP